jgi:hypothetical protein
MRPFGFPKIVKSLKFSWVEIARALVVKSRAIQRWAAGDPNVGGPGAKALLAGHRLTKPGLGGHPEEISNCKEELSSRAPCHELQTGLAKFADDVTARAGSTLHWHVSRRRAATHEIEANFNRLANGLFGPAGYRRSDGKTSVDQDRPLVEEPVAALAGAAKLVGDRQRAASVSRPSTPLAAAAGDSGQITGS